MNKDPLLDRIEKLEEQMKLLRSSTTIPLEVGAAIKTRVLQGITIPNVTVASKSATSENKAVDEGGVATYSVMDKPDGFLQTTITGTTYYIPYFS